jgi:hypothetical protein
MVAEQSHPLRFRLLRFARNDIIRLVDELKKKCPILVICYLYYEVLSFRTHSALLRAGFDAESRPYDKSGFPLSRE